MTRLNLHHQSMRSILNCIIWVLGLTHDNRKRLADFYVCHTSQKDHPFSLFTRQYCNMYKYYYACFYELTWVDLLLLIYTFVTSTVRISLMDISGP